MLHCTGCNTKVHNIFRCIFIHQGINNTTYKCISTPNTVKNMEGKPFAFINLSVYPEIGHKAVLTAAVCKTHMSCNAFDIRISLYKSLEYFFLLFTVRLEWNTILHITCGMIFFIFPDVVRLDSKKNIYIWKVEGTEISCFLPAPQCTSEISVKADGHAVFLCCFQAGQDQFTAAFSKCRCNAAQMKPGVTFQKFFHICFAEIIFGKGTVLSVIHHFTWTDSVTCLQIIGSKTMCRCLFFC